MNPVLLSLVVVCLVGFVSANGGPVEADMDVWRGRLACRKCLTHEDFFPIVKPIGIGTCKQLCESAGASCMQAIKVFPLLEYSKYNCNSIYSNVCCCRFRP